MIAEVDLYGYFQTIELSMYGSPVIVKLEFVADQVRHTLQFSGANPLTSFVSAFEEFWGLKVIDRNREVQQFVEFGRYRVEFWDEDNPYAEATVDSYEYHTDDC